MTPREDGAPVLRPRRGLFERVRRSACAPSFAAVREYLTYAVLDDAYSGYIDPLERVSYRDADVQFEPWEGRQRPLGRRQRGG
eukprot:1770024-Pyramimonas_sp.AAC.1